ncbi:ribosomal protein S5 domain 2-type protein [Xylogone sp. PMI_703]|nr:ribosomal protein S5 domain 2-type protein [Xylogone sp. PMI_703]
MNEQLADELEAINSIYGPSTIIPADDVEPGLYILHLEKQDTSLKLQFPEDYPAVPPSVLGSHSSGEHSRKGFAARVVEEFRNALGNLFQPAEVCLFDVIEEVNRIWEESAPADAEVDNTAVENEHPHDDEHMQVETKQSSFASGPAPPWVLSDVVVEMKSVFVARCAPVTSPEQAASYLQHLLETDKKVRTATHNITAWRIQGENGVTYQDCDDDGETAAGGRVLHLMQLTDVWNVMVVVTRWYGGHLLGPKRFSIINTVARDGLVKGAFVKEDGKKKGKR